MSEDDYTPDPETERASQSVRDWLRARIQRVLAEPPMPEKPVTRQEEPPKPAPKSVAPKSPKRVLPKPAAPPKPPEPPAKIVLPEAAVKHTPFGGQFGRTGRPRALQRDEIVAMKQQGLSMAEIARRLGCSRAALYLPKNNPRAEMQS